MFFLEKEFFISLLFVWRYFPFALLEQEKFIFELDFGAQVLKKRFRYLGDPVLQEFKMHGLSNRK